MKNYAFLSLIALIGLSGCGYRKKKNDSSIKNDMKNTVEVAIPVASVDSHDFLLDEDLDELNFAQESVDFTLAQNKQDVADTTLDEFTWIDENDQDSSFKNIYFAFDSYEIDKDQEEALAYDIMLAKKAIDEYLLFGDTAHRPTIIIDGNSCSSAGPKAYNLVLSEKRAVALEEKFVAAGVPREYIKIVAHGQEVPAIVNGKIVTGDRAAQWPNRRDEVRIIFG